MNFNNDILIELETLSPVLAGLPKSNVFEVPKGYFETLSGTILICIRDTVEMVDPYKTNDIPQGYFDNLSSSILNKIKAQQNNNGTEEIISPLLQSLQPNNIFEVPDGYFDNLISSVLHTIKAQHIGDKEEEISPLFQGVQHKNVFEAPQGYFENLPTSIINKIKDSLVDSLPFVLADARNINVFEVPDGYFETLSSSIIEKATQQQDINALEEIATLSPLLYSLQRTNVFEVPDGYFKNTTAKLLQATKPAPAKVIGMPKRSIFIKLGVAAIITGAMALGIYKYMGGQLTSKGTVQIAQVNNSTKLDSSIAKGKSMDGLQFDAALDNLSKDDITSYLEKNGSDVDLALLTASVDENAVPDKNDYLLDDKTLENYLIKLELQN